MTNSTYGNFDYELCVKILNLLKVSVPVFSVQCAVYLSIKGNVRDVCLIQGAFPARLKCVFIVSSPLWFRAPFAVLRLFVREKLRERVSIHTLLK